MLGALSLPFFVLICKFWPRTFPAGTTNAGPIRTLVHSKPRGLNPLPPTRILDGFSRGRGHRRRRSYYCFAHQAHTRERGVMHTSTLLPLSRLRRSFYCCRGCGDRAQHSRLVVLSDVIFLCPRSSSGHHFCRLSSNCTNSSPPPRFSVCFALFCHRWHHLLLPLYRCHWWCSLPWATTAPSRASSFLFFTFPPLPRRTLARKPRSNACRRALWPRAESDLRNPRTEYRRLLDPNEGKRVERIEWMSDVGATTFRQRSPRVQGMGWIAGGYLQRG